MTLIPIEIFGQSPHQIDCYICSRSQQIWRTSSVVGVTDADFAWLRSLILEPI
ncbi:MAG: hypothetical protein AAFY72_00475 [Cyanobacteria bacterium J06649_4]